MQKVSPYFELLDLIGAAIPNLHRHFEHRILLLIRIVDRQNSM